MPAPPVGAAVAPQPAAPPPPPADPASVTRTLAELKTLVDQGALTQEEYDAKKADLLGRL
jgi:hypothetical protein